MQFRQRYLISAVLMALLCLGTSSCGNVSSSTMQTHSSPTIGTNGSLISIKSDNVSMAGYDDSNGTMTVQFNNGSIYEYYNVASSLWEEFLAAQPHPWSTIGYPKLVRAGIPYRRNS